MLFCYCCKCVPKVAKIRQYSCWAKVHPSQKAIFHCNILWTFAKEYDCRWAVWIALFHVIVSPTHIVVVWVDIVDAVEQQIITSAGIGHQDQVNKTSSSAWCHWSWFLHNLCQIETPQNIMQRYIQCWVAIQKLHIKITNKYKISVERRVIFLRKN